jgi:hypothetical protein
MLIVESTRDKQTFEYRSQEINSNTAAFFADQHIIIIHISSIVGSTTGKVVFGGRRL